MKETRFNIFGYISMTFKNYRIVMNTITNIKNPNKIYELDCKTLMKNR